VANSELDDLYGLFGVSPGASPDALRRAHRKLARQWHPDLHAKDPAGQRLAEERLKRLNAAYDALTSRAPRLPRSKKGARPVPWWQRPSFERRATFAVAVLIAAALAALVAVVISTANR
jgi:curved DNA-binding protein CbpA